jgi:tetratricopeptide (TPR) repeat protein
MLRFIHNIFLHSVAVWLFVMLLPVCESAAQIQQPQNLAPPSRELLEARVQANPQDVEAHVMLARGHLEAGNPAAALPHLKTASELLPRASPLVFQYGVARLETGDVEGAYETLNALAAREPGEVATRAYLTRVCALLQRPDEARQHLAVVRTTAPNQPMLHVQLVEWTATAKVPEVALEQIEFTQRYALPDPAMARVHFLASFARNQLNQRDLAIDSLRKAIELDGSQPRYYSMLLTLQGSDGMRNIDVDMLRNAVRRFPVSADLLLLTGLYNLEMDEFRSVSEIARRLDIVAPGSAEAVLLRGHLSLVNMQFDEAAQYFQTALDKGMNTPHLHHQLGKASEKNGDFQAALRHYAQALAMDTARPALLMDFAQLQHNLGHTALARDLALRLLPMQPENPRVHKLLADIARAEGDTVLAREHLSEFKRLSVKAQATRKAPLP